MVRFYFLIVLLFTLGNAHAKIHFKEVKFKKINPQSGQVEITFDNDVIEIPWLKFEEKKIHLVVPQSEIKSKISKSIQLEKNIDINFVGKKISKENSRLSILLPYAIKKLKKKIHVSLKGRKVFLNFPLVNVVQGNVERTAEKDVYNEKYLQKLIDEKKSTKGNVASKKNIETDIVKRSFSSLPKDREPFSLGKQAIKFFIFLVLVIAVFYGIVLFLKKSVLGKKKLGFLNSTKIVDVINTTYISPKRTIMLVRAHKQVFLIGSSEKGLHSLGELTDVAGLLKEGEKKISGNNFDMSLDSVSKSNQEFSLKEMMESDRPEKPKKSEENMKLREHIKSKVKGLKSLQ